MAPFHRAWNNFFALSNQFQAWIGTDAWKIVGLINPPLLDHEQHIIFKYHRNKITNLCVTYSMYFYWHSIVAAVAVAIVAAVNHTYYWVNMYRCMIQNSYCCCGC